MLLYSTLLFKRAVPTFCLFFHISIIFQYPNPDFGNIGILNIESIFNISIFSKSGLEYRKIEIVNNRQNVGTARLKNKVEY